MSSELLVTKLLESFNELERCIQLTKEILFQKKGVPTDVIARVAQYSDIVAKQRTLAQTLRGELACQNWDEVNRLVKIINGLSSMIRDDAQTILGEAFKGTPSYAVKQNQMLI